MIMGREKEKVAGDCGVRLFLLFTSYLLKILKYAEAQNTLQYVQNKAA